MSGGDAIGTTLRELLDDGIRGATGFAQDLRAELDALETEDIDALQAAAAGKQSRLEALEGVEAGRRRLLAEQGLADDAGGMRALIDAADTDGSLAERWRRYLKVADDCKQANLTNGAIIRLRQQQVTSALAALAGAEPQTYGPGGSERPGASRQLAEA